MGVRARIADGAMAGTAWSLHRENWAGLRPVSRGSAKPGRMTRRQANVSAALFSCPAGCAEDPIMDVSPGGAAGGSLPSAFIGCRCGARSAANGSATPRYGSRRTPGFATRRNHLGTGGPSRRPPAAGCAGRRPAQFSRWGLQAVPAVVVAGGRRSLAGGAITMVGVPVKPALSWQPAGGRCPPSDTPSPHSVPALHA